MNVILASASPRRKELIARISGLHTQTHAAQSEENAPFINPGWYACALARHKAEEVAARLNTDEAVVGADTIVVLDGKPLGKPADVNDAKRMLSSISGREHTVITGVCVADRRRTVCFYAETAVALDELSEEFIRAYAESGSPLDKAGAYGIQDEMFAPHVIGIRGDRDNVIGLPVAALKKTLKEYFGWEE